MITPPKKTLLVIENDPGQLELIVDILGNNGFSVLTAKTGSEALEVLSGNVPPDLTLLDLDNDGSEVFLTKIREMQETPIIYLSKSFSKDSLDKSHPVTPYGYVLRDCCSEALISSVNVAYQLVENRRKMKDKEAELQHLNSVIKSLNDVHQTLFHETDKRTLLKNICSVVVDKNQGYYNCWIALLGPDSKLLEYYDNGTNPEQAFLMNQLVDSGKLPGCVSKIISEKSVVVIKEPLQECPECPLSQQYRDRAALGMRLDHDGTVYGVVCVSVKRAYAFNEQQHQLFSQFARDIAYAYWSLEMDEQREINETNYYRILGSLPFGVIVCRLDGTINYFNKRSEKIFNCSAAEVQDRNISMFCPPHKTDEQKRLIREMINDEKVQDYDTVRKTCDGKLVAVNMSLSLRKDNLGRPIGIVGVFRDIRERDKFKRALQASEQKMRSIFRAAPVGIGVVRERVLVEVNNQMCEMTGYSSEELIGKTARLLYPSQEEFEYVGTEKYRQIQEKGWGAVETRFVKKDGSIINVWLASSPIDKKDLLKGVSFTALDITERTRIQEALEDSEAKYRLLVENQNDLVIQFDKNYKILYVSPTYCKTFGLESSELMGKSFLSLVHEEDQANTKSSIGDIFKPPYSYSLMERAKTVSGYRWFAWSGKAVLTDSGEVESITSLGRDITILKETELAVQKLLTDKEILLKEVHHRIGNNFATISGILSLHLNENQSPEINTVLQDVLSRIDSMRILYNRLLQTDDYMEIPVQVYFDELMDGILNIFPGNNVRIERKYDAFTMNPKQMFYLGIIVNELITNCMKYAFPDNQEGTIGFTLENRDSRIKLTVSDNGPGMPDKPVKTGSSGFGMMLIRMLTEQLEGELSIENQAGTVVTIAFDLPEE